MMTRIGNVLQTRDIDFDADDRHVMCFAHTVNLPAQRVISGMTLWNEELDIPPPSDVARNPVTIGRNVVRVIRASGLRRDAFDAVIENGNSKGLFKHGDTIIQVKKLQLLRSVPTRWDSNYYMLNRLRELQPVHVVFKYILPITDRFHRLWIISSLSQKTTTSRCIR